MKLSKSYLKKEVKEPKMSKMTPKQKLHEKRETKSKEKAEHKMPAKMAMMKKK